jgi:hypothetical protein
MACEILVQLDPLETAAALDAFLSSGLSTRIRRMASAAAAKKRPQPVPVLVPVRTHQPHISFVHQGRRLECLPRFLPGQLRGRQPAQLLVDERQELLGVVRLALLDGGQTVGHVVSHNV